MYASARLIYQCPASPGQQIAHHLGLHSPMTYFSRRDPDLVPLYTEPAPEKFYQYVSFDNLDSITMLESWTDWALDIAQMIRLITERDEGENGTAK